MKKLEIGSMLPFSRGTVLVTVENFEERALTQVVENKGMADAGFEPATSTVCRKHGKKKLKK